MTDESVAQPTLQEKLDTIKSDVAAAVSAEKSAEALLGAYNELLRASIDNAKAQGATDEQLAQLDELHNTLNGAVSSLSKAVAANTPAVPDNTGTGQPTAVVISHDPATDEPLPAPTVVSEHPETGEVLLTPVESGPIPNAVGDVVLDPSTGVPSVPEGSETVLGDTTPAPEDHPNVDTLVGDITTVTPVVAVA